MHTDLPPEQIVRKTAHAVFWNWASFGLGKGLVFFTTVILARLLTPEDFGTVALATLALSIFSIAGDLGLCAALIREKDHPEEAAGMVFALNSALSAVLTITTFMIAPAVAAYFREPRVTNVLRALSLTFVLNALGAVHTALLQRDLNFRRKLIPDTGRSLVKGAVSVASAVAGLGVWSLVIGQLAGSLSASLLAWHVLRWRPNLRFHLGLARRMLTFGSSLVGVEALSVAEDSVDRLIVGRAFGSHVMGIYTLACRIPEFVVANTLWVTAAALFPAYASVQNRMEILRKGFLATLRYVSMITTPLCLGLFIAADPIVRVAFGAGWIGAVPILRILAIFAFANSIGFNVGDVYKAIGRADVLLKLGTAKLAVLIPALIYGARFGILGIAWAHVAVSTLAMLLRLSIAARTLDLQPRQLWSHLQPSMIGSVSLLAAAGPMLYTVPGPAAVRLFCVALAGAASYLATLWFADRSALCEAARLVFRRDPSGVATATR